MGAAKGVTKNLLSAGSYVGTNYNDPANAANWWVDGGNTYLSADTSGDGVADFSIMMQGVHSLDAATNVVL